VEWLKVQALISSPSTKKKKKKKLIIKSITSTIYIFIIKTRFISWVWWYTPVIPALWRWRQYYAHEFKASLYYKQIYHSIYITKVHSLGLDVWLKWQSTCLARAKI
jgi:hypothetical protein